MLSDIDLKKLGRLWGYVHRDLMRLRSEKGCRQRTIKEFQDLLAEADPLVRFVLSEGLED